MPLFSKLLWEKKGRNQNIWRVKIFLNTKKLYHILKTKKNFDFRDNIKLANEVQKYKYMWQGLQTTCVFSFSKNVFYPNQTFLRLDFCSFFRRGFDNVLNRAFLNFTNTLFLQESDPSTQSCLCFQDFQGPKLFNGCSVLWPNKQTLSVFQ